MALSIYQSIDRDKESHHYGVRCRKSKFYERQQNISIAETVPVFTLQSKLTPSPSIHFFSPTNYKESVEWSMDRNAKTEDSEFVRPDENTKIPRSNVNSSFRYIPEDSCDSVISLEDVEDDDDDDDSSEAIKPSNRSFQGPTPGRAAKPQEPSAVEELQALMLSVREATTTPKENQDKSQDGKKICKIESSMEVDYQKEKSAVTVPNLEMVEEPEESYRARYESEGCRGPIRGVSENGFPTVRVNGYSGSVLMTVYLVTECGEPHLHSITGPGSTKTMCKEVTLEGNVSAIQTWIGPEQNMTAVWDSLSVRRIRNWDADKKLRERGDNPAAWKAKKKEARLMFQCNVPQTTDRPGYILTCQSRPFMCTAPSGNPEIWWISENESTPNGGKEIAIIGKKFSTGFRVRFYGTDSGGLWEAYADVDKSKSHQGAIVLKVPQYKALDIDRKIEVLVEVRVGPEKDKRCSESIAFSYKPDSNAEAKRSEPCSYCNSVKSALSHLFGKDSKASDLAQESDLAFEPEKKRPPAKIEDSPNRLQSPKEQLSQNERAGNLDKDIQMSDISKQEHERQRKDLEKGEGYFQEVKEKSSNVAHSRLFQNQIGQNVSDSALVHLLLQSQTAGANVPLIHGTVPSTINSVISLVSAVPSGTISIPSQATAPVAVPQLIGSTQTKLHTGLSVLATPQNVTLLPNSMPNVPERPVRVCVLNSQSAAATYGLSNVFTSARIISSSGASHNIPAHLQVSGITAPINMNVTTSFSGAKSQEYIVIPGMTLVDGAGLSSLKNDVNESKAVRAASVSCFQPQIGSSWSLSEKPQMSTTSVQPMTTVRSQPGLINQNSVLAQGSVTSNAVFLLSQRPVASASINLPASVAFSGNASNILQTQFQNNNIQQQKEQLSTTAQNAFASNYSIANSTTMPGMQTSLPARTISALNTMSQPMFVQNVMSDGLITPSSSVMESPSVAVNVLGPVSAYQSAAPTNNVFQALASNVTVAMPLSQNSWPQSTNPPAYNQAFSSPSTKVDQAFDNQLPSTFQTPTNQQQFSPMLSNATVQALLASQPLLQKTEQPYNALPISQEVSFQDVTGFTSCVSSSLPNTSMQVTPSFSDNPGPTSGQIIGEQIQEKESILAHDLNRLSVVGSLAQSNAFSSEPRNIPRSMTHFNPGLSGVSPSLSDPQPMSLTDDSLTEVIADFMKQPPANEMDKPAIGAEHQHQQLVNSFLVPQLRNAEKQNETSSQFIPYSHEEAMNTVNKYIVGEDAMFSGPDLSKSSNSSVWTDGIQSIVTPQTSAMSLASSSAINTSMWNQPSHMVQSQSDIQGRKSDSIVIDGDKLQKSGFVSDYVDEEGTMRSAVYESVGSNPYTAVDKSSQQQTNIHLQEALAAKMTQMPNSTEQQAASVLPAAQYGHVQNQSTVDLGVISSGQEAYYENQNFSNINSMAASQHYPLHDSTSGSAEGKLQLQTQSDTPNFNHQPPVNEPQNLLSQNKCESLSRVNAPMILESHATPGSASELEQAKLELIRDTGLLVAEGTLNQREAESLYASVQRNDSLLLEMYRTSKKDSESRANVVEILKHWVNQFV
eukprot:gene93-9705_t